MRSGGKLLLTVSLSIASSAAICQRAARPMQPVVIGNPAEWFGPDEYPPDAVRAGRSGRTVAKLGIDSTGKVVTCTIDRSSGTTSLDEKTCELAYARGRFDPATDAGGRPTAGVFTLPVRWLVPENAPGTMAIDVTKTVTLSSVFEWIIDADGLVESCRSLGSAPSVGVDRCRQFPSGSAWGARYTIGGQPVRAVVRDTSGRSVEAAALIP